MRVAFYAPLKPPDWPVPSGDRLLARMFLEALARAGHDALVASRLRSFDKSGDRARQDKIRTIGATLADHLVRRYMAAPQNRRPELWFTYHLYHKAPDWIGPTVSQALAIPYVAAEASFAAKRAQGPWSDGHEAVRCALAVADLVVGLNSTDEAGVRTVLRSSAQFVQMGAFLDCAPFAAAARKGPKLKRSLAAGFGLESARPLLLTAAMMRSGNKLASFRVLAHALACIEHHDWHLLIAGSGPAEHEVREVFAPLRHRVTWLGQLPRAQLVDAYAAADLFVWPAVDEPIGMAFIEAQAAATPVIGGCARGVPDVVDDGTTGLLTPEGDAVAFAEAITTLLGDRARLRAMGAAACQYAASRHDIAPAATKLSNRLEALVE